MGRLSGLRAQHPGLLQAAFQLAQLHGLAHCTRWLAPLGLETRPRDCTVGFRAQHSGLLQAAFQQLDELQGLAHCTRWGVPLGRRPECVISVRSACSRLLH